MGRGKVKLQYIINKNSRKTTFRKRNKGLEKKVTELSTLCDIKVAKIVYSPFAAQPEVFPSQPIVDHVLKWFHEMPDMEKTRNMLNQEAFLKQRIAKAKEHIRHAKQDNREKEITRIMFNCLNWGNPSNFETDDLTDVMLKVEQMLMKLDIKMQEKKETQLNQMGAASVTEEVGLMTGSAIFSEGNNQEVEHQQHGGAVWSMQQEIMHGSGHMQQEHQQLLQQHPWFMDIMNPPAPQAMDFLHPIPMLPPGAFGAYNNDSATGPSNSSSRLP